MQALENEREKLEIALEREKEERQRLDEVERQKDVQERIRYMKSNSLENTQQIEDVQKRLEKERI